jgi:TctA family transporter
VFALMLLGLDSFPLPAGPLKAWMMAALGLFISVGQDRMVGTLRFTYSVDVLWTVGLVPWSGLFRWPRFYSHEQSLTREVFKTHISSFFPVGIGRILPFWGGSILGFLLGFCPAARGDHLLFRSYDGKFSDPGEIHRDD